MDWVYDNQKRKMSRMITPDVKRYTKAGVLEYAEKIWKQFGEPNMVKKTATDQERAHAAKEYMTMVIEEHARTENLTDDEFVYFMRLRREKMNLTIEEFRTTPEFKKQLERVNAEIRQVASERNQR